MHNSINLIISILFLLLIQCFNSSTCSSASTNPKTIPQQRIAEVIKSIPEYTHFSISGLRFYNNKLYASTNIGLLELENGTAAKLYSWLKKDDVVGGPWLDSANNLLWLWHLGINRLVHFNGTDWMDVNLPQPKNGYTRGDILKGFRGISNKEYFWLEGASQAWRWDNKNNVWIQETKLPPTGSLVRILPIQKDLLFVTRHEVLDFLTKNNIFKSDTIQYFSGQWRESQNNIGKSFFAEQGITFNGTAYIRTRDGDILRVTLSEVTAVKTPGFCEALTFTSKGSLLASIRNRGIFELTDQWNLRFDYPLEKDDDHWAYVAESNGQVAFATTPMPKLTKNYKPTFTGTTALWFSIGDKLELIKL